MTALLENESPRATMPASSARKAIVTVGMGFGDEGKGATVDFLVRAVDADLVVRYSGGGQAGHNLELPDGRRHTFSQFGAGTFAGARTYLGPRMIVSPATMLPEAEHLRKLGVTAPFDLLTVHPDCLISTRYHVLMNRLRELARGDARHGSCGLGIGETRRYWINHGTDAVVASDLLDRNTLIAKLTLLRERMLLDMQELPKLDRALSIEMHETRTADEASMLQFASAEFTFSRDLPAGQTVVFEGAQGVLLDEWHGFHPYTTWSTVTDLHAREMIDSAGIDDVTVLGITRAYSTRHGAGPFPTECRRMTEQIRDPGNIPNDWQGRIRSGPLDLVLLRYAAEVCGIDALVVNGLDQLPPTPQVCTAYHEFDTLAIPHSIAEQKKSTQRLQSVTPVLRDVSSDELLDELRTIAPVAIEGHGPRHVHRRFMSAAVSS